MEIQATDTSVALDLTVNGPSGGITGLTCTVAIRLVATGAPQYLDWSSNTFKTSGWTTQFQSMTEIGRGHYEKIFNVAVLALGAGAKLSAEYHFSGGGLLGDTAELLAIVTTVADTTLARKYVTNRLVEVSGSPGTLTLYDDDGVTALRTHQITDENGGAVLPAIGTPGRRSAGS